MMNVNSDDYEMMNEGGGERLKLSGGGSDPVRHHQSDKVKLNVGGKRFVTSRTTLKNAGRGSMLAAMVSDTWNAQSSFRKEFFIDRNPAYFSILLDLLRTAELHIPPHISEKALCREALFYGILDRVRAARTGQLDGNRVDCIASVSGQAIGDAIAIRAASDGGCCVAHGSMVHVYDWAMEQEAPLSLDYLNVNDVVFLNPQRVAIGACERSEREGGLAAFNVKTGKAEHRFHVSNITEGLEARNFTPGALSISDSALFASCRVRSISDGLASWDQTTGQHLNFFSTPGMGDACKLQWLSRSNLLLVASLYPRSVSNCYIKLLDVRSNEMVWSWVDGGGSRLCETILLDTLAMEESNTICVVNEIDYLGFLDMRQNPSQKVRWRQRHEPPTKVSEMEERFYSKLASSGSQLFASKNDGVYVFCSPDLDTSRCVQTAVLRKPKGGSICDIAVGGERVFVLHNDEDVFDVWETRGPYWKHEHHL